MQRKLLPIFFQENYPILCRGPAGTGKTVTAVLGMLHAVKIELKKPQIFYVCPTREIGRATHELIQSLSKFTQIKSHHLLPNTALSPDAQIVLGTTGRFQDGIRRKQLDLKNVSLLVVDEASEFACYPNYDQLAQLIKWIQRGSPCCRCAAFYSVDNMEWTRFREKVLTPTARYEVRVNPSFKQISHPVSVEYGEESVEEITKKKQSWEVHSNKIVNLKWPQLRVLLAGYTKHQYTGMEGDCQLPRLPLDMMQYIVHILEQTPLV